MSFSLSRRLAALIAVLSAIAGLVTVTLVDDDHDGRPDRVHVTPRVPAAIADQHQVAGAPAPSDSTPDVAGVDEARAKADNAAAAAQQTYDASGVLQGATAEPAHITCHTPGHGAARALSKIRLGVVHVTIGPNATGLADLHGLCNYFAGQKLSATWIVDNEGNSAENQPLTITPWTQAFYNTYSCSIEFVGYTGRPGEGPAQWTDAQLREGARLMAQCFKKAGVPVQRGAVTRDGHITRAGVVTHQELGLLGGGHTDPGPHFDMNKFMQLLEAYATGATASSSPTSSARLTAGERRAASCLQAERRIAHRHGGWQHVAPSHVRRASSCKAQLRRANLRIHAAAKTSGWDRLDRRARHRAIHALI